METEGLGRKALLVRTDVSLTADPREMVRRTEEEFGRLDILVNHAGWTGTTLALDVTGAELDRVRWRRR
jgi:NAD(P)-dependent dehydrogenase (short-subunit alcohol dehydrogenase family)